MKMPEKLFVRMRDGFKCVDMLKDMMKSDWKLMFVVGVKHVGMGEKHIPMGEKHTGMGVKLFGSLLDFHWCVGWMHCISVLKVFTSIFARFRVARSYEVFTA